MLRYKRFHALTAVTVGLSLSVTAEQRNSDSRDKTEKVSDVSAALEARPGKMSGGVGPG